MAFAKSRWQRWRFVRLALAPEGSCPRERISLELRRYFAAEDVGREDYKSCRNQIKKSEFIQKKKLTLRIFHPKSKSLTSCSP